MDEDDSDGMKTEPRKEKWGEEGDFVHRQSELSRLKDIGDDR